MYCEWGLPSSNQVATCPAVYQTPRKLFIAQCQAGKLEIQVSVVFGLTRAEIEPESTVSRTDALSIRGDQ